MCYFISKYIKKMKFFGSENEVVLKTFLQWFFSLKKFKIRTEEFGCYGDYIIIEVIVKHQDKNILNNYTIPSESSNALVRLNRKLCLNTYF